jgi:hypothetical protein
VASLKRLHQTEDSMADSGWTALVRSSTALVFVIDLIANMLSFSNRLMSALVTAVVVAVFFAFLNYVTGGVPTTAT